MRSPSIKALRAAFRDLSEDDAKHVKALAALTDDGEKLEAYIREHCPETAKYADSCHGDPFDTHNWCVTMALHAIDILVGGCGVEALGPVDMRHGPPYEYVNVGDPYTTTLMYRRDTDNLYVGCYGTVAERHPNW